MFIYSVIFIITSYIDFIPSCDFQSFYAISFHTDSMCLLDKQDKMIQYNIFEEAKKRFKN